MNTASVILPQLTRGFMPYSNLNDVEDLVSIGGKGEVTIREFVIGEFPV